MPNSTIIPRVCRKETTTQLLYKYTNATNHKKDRNHEERKRERNATLISMRREEYHPEIQFWCPNDSTTGHKHPASCENLPRILRQRPTLLESVSDRGRQQSHCWAGLVQWPGRTKCMFFRWRRISYLWDSYPFPHWQWRLGDRSGEFHASWRDFQCGFFGHAGPQGRFTPWKMAFANGPNWWSNFNGPFLKKLVHKFLRCKLNVDQEDWPCIKKWMWWSCVSKRTILKK